MAANQKLRDDETLLTHFQFEVLFINFTHSSFSCQLKGVDHSLHHLLFYIALSQLY